MTAAMGSVCTEIRDTLEPAPLRVETGLRSRALWSVVVARGQSMLHPR